MPLNPSAESYSYRLSIPKKIGQNLEAETDKIIPLYVSAGGAPSGTNEAL